MAYLVLAISLIYALLWGAGLMLSLRSDGNKSVWIPVLGLLLFVGFSAGSAMAVQTAIANPPRLTVQNFLAARVGMTPEDLNGLFGTPKPDDLNYDFKGDYSITFPEEVASRLRDATMSIKIVGEPGRVHPTRGEGLGAPANEEKNGIVGLEIVLRENGNELRILEGQDWTYEEQMTAEDVAKKLGELIDASDAWHAQGSPDSDPRSVIITPEIETNRGTVCNEACSAQIMQVTTAANIRGFTDGSEQKFKGGEDETWVTVWQEDGVLMDADFSTSNHMIIAGFVKGEMVGITQSGLDMPPEPPSEAPAE
jgi:hypothetical protein